MLENEANQKEKLEDEIAELRSHLLQLSFEAEEVFKEDIDYLFQVFLSLSACILFFSFSFGYVYQLVSFWLLT